MLGVVLFKFSNTFILRSYLGRRWAKIWLLYFLTFLVNIESL